MESWIGDYWSGFLVEPWQVILEWNQKLNSSGEICLGVNDTIVKCVTNA